MTPSLVELKVPSVGESVTEVEVSEWLKPEGAFVRKDEAVVVLETDKATTEIPAPANGTVARILKKKGDRVRVGEVLGELALGDAPAQAPAVPAPAIPAAAAPAAEAKAKGHVMPAAARLMAEKGVTAEQVTATGPGGRVLKEDVQRAAEQPVPAVPPSLPSPAVPPAVPPPPAAAPEAPAKPLPAGRTEEVVPMTLLRRKIAERLVLAQHQAAILTTFNEIDMSAVMALRKDHQERFSEKHGVKLGFMSFFVKAVIEALKEFPQVNAEIRGASIVYRNYYDIGIAIGGGRGLVVPVLRGAERMSFAEIEKAIAAFAQKIKENTIKPDDLAGGTFTITNGGVYGSLLSTPIINPPQSGVLGMHSIQDRPVALNGQVVIRPMMYLALSYDHRLVDGREAVTFLKRIKELVEHPVRILIEI
jgi:2-oxoglutarate dehydrogenase E2 component (dihydrolipoamide succinyltransferase)